MILRTKKSQRTSASRSNCEEPVLINLNHICTIEDVNKINEYYNTDVLKINECQISNDFICVNCHCQLWAYDLITSKSIPHGFKFIKEKLESSEPSFFVQRKSITAEIICHNCNYNSKYIVPDLKLGVLMYTRSGACYSTK